MSSDYPPHSLSSSGGGELRSSSMKYVAAVQQQQSSDDTPSEKKSLSKSLRKTFQSISLKHNKVTQEEISACVKQLDRQQKDEQWDFVLQLMKDELKPMLISYINNQQDNNQKPQATDGTSNSIIPLTKSTSFTSSSGAIIIDKNLGPVTVEILRNNLNTNEILVKECAGILYLLSIINPNFKKAVARLFQAMNNYPSNLDLLEDSTLAIQNCITSNSDSHVRIAPSLPTLYKVLIKHSTKESTLLVGAALNILEDLAYNPEMSNNKYLSQSCPALLKVLELDSNEFKIQSCRILGELSHPNNGLQQVTSSGQNYQQNILSQIGLQIHLLLQCCKDSTNDELQKATAMQVIANVSIHTPSHKGFIHRRAVPQIIKLLTSTTSSEDCRYQSCRAIANLTIPQTEPSIRKTAAPTVIESGGISALIKTMQKYCDNEVLLQIQGCIAISNLCKLSGNSGGDNNNNNNSNNGNPTSSPTRTTTGTGTNPTSPISPMSPSSMKFGVGSGQYDIMDEIIKSGAIPAVLTALKVHKSRKDLQVFANRALYLLLVDRIGIQEMIDYINDSSSNGGTGISVILKGMTYHASSASVQISALKVLSKLTTQDDFELLLSEGGLDVLLTIVFNFCGCADDVIDDTTNTIRRKHNGDIRHREICLLTCEILKNFTKPVPGSEKSIQQSLDLQRAVASKEGIPILLIIIEKHGSGSTSAATKSNSNNNNKKSSSEGSSSQGNLQEAALACMRNIVLHPSNRLLIDDAGISTIINCMSINKSNAAIQAYGFDTLGRLASLPAATAASNNNNNDDITRINNNSSVINIRRSINSERGIQLSIEALQFHSLHPGVQDRVVFFLVNMTEGVSEIETLASYENLLQLNPLPLLQSCKQRMPHKGQERLKILIQRVQQKSSSSSSTGQGVGGGGVGELVGGRLMGFFGGGGGGGGGT